MELVGVGERRFDDRMLSPRALTNVCLVMFVLIGVAPTRSEARDDDRAWLGSTFRSLMSACEEGNLSGAVAAVGNGEEELYVFHVGVAALEPQLEEFSSSSLFDLASLTKVVATTPAVMLCVERGWCALEDPVAQHLPEFAAHGKEHVTIEQLLLHRGGLPPANSLEEYAEGAASAWSSILGSPLRTTPGEEFVYSDVGFLTLGKLVERLDPRGRSLDVFCEQELYAPLGMRQTSFAPRGDLRAAAVPTEADEAGTMLRGVVHDPRSRALGGVAGHAGLFSTDRDLGRYCRMLLGRGVLDGVRVLSEASVAEMLRVRWSSDGSDGRALGWDVDTRFSSPRGPFARGRSFGHTGFTGTSLWIDPAANAYAVLLSSRLHPDGEGSATPARRALARAFGALLGVPQRATAPVHSGLDVLVDEGFAAIAGQRVGLLTNKTGVDRQGRRNVDLLREAQNVELVCVLTPEHGFDAVLEGSVADSTDAASGLPLYSLYGETRRPTAEMLAGLDVLVFDIADVGARFYTYISTLDNAMQAASEYGVRVVVLDRPNPLAPLGARGPVADSDRLSFIATRELPLVHGLTVGEVARYFQAHFTPRVELEVVAMRDWSRSMWFEDTGLPWVNPSPNMRNPTQALLYPALGLIEFCEVSVGRGTDEPFERFGAPWIDGVELASALRAAELPGLAFAPLRFTPEASRFEGEECQGVGLSITDRAAVRPVEAGLRIAWELTRLYGEHFDPAGISQHLADAATYAALRAARDPRGLPAVWEAELERFEQHAAAIRLYR